jgi:sugar lactone lactonase YvrE
MRWVDIVAGTVHSARLVDASLEDHQMMTLGQTTGAVVVAHDGGLVVAGARGLVAISPQGDVSLGPDLLGARVNVRLNDAGVDPQGRLVVGTLALSEPGFDELLLRISPSGDVEVLRDGLTLSNGIAWSPDDATIYHVDTLARTVASHPYSAEGFEGEWEVILSDFAGYPDGMTVDADGMLWVAEWGGGCVRRFTPDGRFLESVEVESVQPSCVGFVGEHRDRLAITTAKEGLGSAPADLSGALFIVDVDATGLPASLWGGSTTTPYWATEATRPGYDSGNNRIRFTGAAS